MKKTILIFICLISVSVFSQKIIKSPKSNYSTDTALNIQQIELKDTCTIVYFKYSGFPGNSIWIPKKSFICDVKTQKKMYVTGVIGLGLEKHIKIPKSGTISYSMIFPKLNKDVININFGEANSGGTWFIYDIRLDKSLVNSEVSEANKKRFFRVFSRKTKHPTN